MCIENRNLLNFTKTRRVDRFLGEVLFRLDHTMVLVCYYYHAWNSSTNVKNSVELVTH